MGSWFVETVNPAFDAVWIPADVGASYLTNWILYPFPVGDAKADAPLVWQQQIQCVRSGANAWSFHLDSLTYTSGCPTPPPNFADACDSAMFQQVSNAIGELATLHGAFAACSESGSQLIIIVNGTQLTDIVPGTNGDPAPGVIVCDAGTAIADNQANAKQVCGLGSGPAQLAPWHFTPLPVAAGPVDSATFDTAAGTACITVGAQSFTFTVATSAVTPGCAGAPPATATP